MSEVLLRSDDPIDELRTLMRAILASSYTDMRAMQSFLTLYLRYDFKEGRDAFYERMDIPDLDFEYWEGIFDEVLSAYDDAGGSKAALEFPETGRIHLPDWSEELDVLVNLFQTGAEYAESEALYTRMHAYELIIADSQRFLELITHPIFLKALLKVYEFEDEYRGTEDLPDNWPNKDDEFLFIVLKSLGYAFADTYALDWSQSSKDKHSPYIAKNLRAIQQLESHQPGIVRYLSETFGIRHFSRYALDLLLKQAEKQGIAERPYGVCISAVADHNGAFTNLDRSLDSRTTQVYRQADVSHDFFVAEANSAEEFKERVRLFDVINGKRFKIDFALIQTHGSPYSIMFGVHYSLGSLTLDARLKDVRSIFSARASILLTGCESGRENGIAQTISRQLSTVVVAPSEITSISNIAFVEGSDQIRLIPEYRKPRIGEQPPVSMIYSKGRLMGAKRSADYLQHDVQRKSPHFSPNTGDS